MSLLFNLPTELVEYIFAYLNGQELLKTRLTCSHLDSMIKDFKKGRWDNKTPKLLAQPKDFKNYHECSLKLTNIHILKYFHQPPRTLRSNGGPGFLESSSPSFIKKLTVGEFFACIQEKEFEFYKSFTNLEELKIDTLCFEENVNRRFVNQMPQNFQKLKILKVEDIYWGNQFLNDYYWGLIHFCSKTEIIKVPNLVPYFLEPRTVFEKLMSAICNRNRTSPSTHKKFTFFDLKNVFHKCDLKHFLIFVDFCYTNDVKLKNVDARYLKGFNDLEPARSREPVESTIFSFVDFKKDCLRFEWKNVERLNLLRSITNSELLPWVYLELPKLSSLSIGFNPTEVEWEEGDNHKRHCLIGLLFPNDGKVWRPNLTHLSLCFTSNDYEDSSETFRLEDYLDGGAKVIVKNAPNLKKLEITCWKTMHAPEFFTGLPKLEELCIQSHSTLTDVELIGDSKTPVFMKLIGLKKLTLTLDTLLGVTDEAFKHVFSQMNLQELNIYSEEPLKNLTSKGIEALAEGPFANSIRIFSFKTFSLAGVSPKQFERLEMLFRCNR